MYLVLINRELNIFVKKKQATTTSTITDYNSHDSYCTEQSNKNGNRRGGGRGMVRYIKNILYFSINHLLYFIIKVLLELDSL